MDIITLFSLAVGLAMDAFAVSICKGLAQEKLSVKHMVIAGLWFGGFQALMPTLGYFLGSQFRDKITAVDHWIAFILLGFIGVNMITGRLKASWASASKPEPVVVSAGKRKSFVTELNNDMDYASYVNNGHRLRRHFVPGLYIDDNGLLSYDPKMAADKSGGIVVGTKTRYVKGEFMVDKAKEAYEKTLISELDKEIEVLFK